jgi:hypothetical protein
MNNKYGRDEGYRGDDRYRSDGENRYGVDNRYNNDNRYSIDDPRRIREPHEPFWRGAEGDRSLRSPDREFETSANYQEPFGGISTRRERDEGAYAPSPYNPAASRYNPGRYGQNQGYGGRDFGASNATPGFARQVRGGFSGRGPKGYTRTDDRIREDVCDRLSWNDEVDATEVIVRVTNGEVTLEGSVETRHMKRLAEDVAEEVAGVSDVHNQIRVTKPILTELKEKITGDTDQSHYANTGTKTTGAVSSSSARNGQAEQR